MTREPTITPLTAREESIVLLAAKGYGTKRIARTLGMNINTATSHVQRICLKIGNPDDLHPLTRVQLWGAYREWSAQLALDDARKIA